MTNTNILNPTIAKILEDYNVVKVASKRKVAEEAQDGIDSELKNQDSGSAVDDDGIFSRESVLDESNSSLIDPEGGRSIMDGQIPIPDTPEGEQSDFDNYMTGESGGAETKKTNTDPGYHDSTPVSSELSISGSTVEKGAAFMKKLQKFASTQQSFTTKIAVMAKIAEGLGGLPAPEAEMAPEEAMAGMAGPGQGMPEEVTGGTGELTPQDEALIEAIIETQTSEDPLSPEEIAQMEAIIGSGEDAGAMGEDAGALGGDIPPELAAAAMPAEADPMAAGGLPPEEALGAMPEPDLADEEIKLANEICDIELNKEAEFPSDCGSIGCGLDMGLLGQLAAENTDSFGGEDLSGGMDAGGLDEVLNSLSNQDLITLLQAVDADAEGVEASIESQLCGSSGEGSDDGFDGGSEESSDDDDDDYEPRLDEKEASMMFNLSQAGSVEEYKEAAYYGMSVPELRIAKDKTFKQAALQAKSAEQSKKAKRYGQTIDSLIRK